MKQTAVEFQTEKIGNLVSKLFNYEISKAEFHFTRFEICEQAKEIEKQQQGYSEEDMRECWMACLGFNKPDKFNSRVKFEQWFEQFKNK